MSGFLKLVSMAGVLILIVLVVLVIVSAFGGMEASYSNPPS